MNLTIKNVEGQLSVFGCSSCLNELIDHDLNAMGMPLDNVPEFSIEEFYKLWHLEGDVLNPSKERFLDTLLIIEKLWDVNMTLKGLLRTIENDISEKELPPVLNTMYMGSI